MKQQNQFSAKCPEKIFSNRSHLASYVKVVKGGIIPGGGYNPGDVPSCQYRVYGTTASSEYGLTPYSLTKKPDIFLVLPLVNRLVGIKL